MTCLKTGCNVYFTEYGFKVRTDLHKIGNDTYFVSWEPDTEEYCPIGEEDQDYWLNVKQGYFNKKKGVARGSFIGRNNLELPV